MLKIADVSSYQGNDISGILNANDGVIVKATQSTDYVNPSYQAQVSATRNAGKKLGVYHFIQGGVEVNAQAQHFLDTVGGLATDDQVALILDFENNASYPVLSGNEPRQFADYVYNKTGKKIWLYISNSDIRGGGHGYYWSDMNDNPVWVAGYPLNDGSGYTKDLQDWADSHYFNNLPWWGENVTMWQFDSNPYDQSVFYGDQGTWDKLAQRVNKPAEQPAPTPQPAPQPDPTPTVTQPAEPTSTATSTAPVQSESTSTISTSATNTSSSATSTGNDSASTDRKPTGVHEYNASLLLKVANAIIDFFNHLFKK
jgi:lysozyme